MSTRLSSLTTYDRAPAVKRKEIREKALKIKCPYCGAKVGERRKGQEGKPSSPHWERRNK